eukprot:1731889-Rhodomonas_salina.1
MKRADLRGFALLSSPACFRKRIACKVRAANGLHDCSCRLSSTVKAKKVAASAMHGLPHSLVLWLGCEADSLFVFLPSRK